MTLSYAEIKIGSSVIPAGDPAEQLMANLMLCILAYYSGVVDIGKKHLEYAHSIAAKLEKLGQTYRCSNIIKVVGITSGTDDESATLMLPIVGDHLVVPGISVQQLAKRLKSIPDDTGTISLQQLNIEYYRLRLRPARVRRSLAGILELEAADNLAMQTEELLTACLADRLINVEAIDLAYALLGLVYDFSAAGNFILAEMAVNQANRVIDEWADGDKERCEMQPFTNFKAQVQLLARELKTQAF
jgi:hypothetical protein